MHKFRFIVSMSLFVLVTSIFITTSTTISQTSQRPLIMPVADTPSPSTWLFGQAYGNTLGAYNFGQAWYSAGQGLHFGIDLPMRCSTELVAVADGEVAFVDNLNFGAGPHNLILRHPALGITSLYGHLLEPSTLFQGQTVAQGQVVGLSGDPDSTCDSRPHLHFEIRSLDYRIAYNPVDYIDANWHMLTSIGGYSYPLFQQDLDNSRRWMTVEDQPSVAFGGTRLNNYQAVWPLAFDLLPPPNPPITNIIEALPQETNWGLRQIGYDGCCWRRWWHPSDADRLFVIDGVNNQRAGIFEWSAEAGAMVNVIDTAPPAIQSPDGTHQIFNNGNTVTIRNTLDNSETIVNTQGTTPALNTDNTQLVWVIRASVTLPGQPAPNTTIWISDIDGTNTRELMTDTGLSASWLDHERLLIRIAGEGRLTTLSVYNTRDNSAYQLGTWRNIRGLSVAPSGGRLMFYVTWQDDSINDGIWMIETTQGAIAQRMPFFGSWRWRDADSVYYLPFDLNSPHHTLAYYHIPTGENRVLTSPETLPFTIMNGDWDVSADGRRMVFQNALDRNMWLLEMIE